MAFLGSRTGVQRLGHKSESPLRRSYRNQVLPTGRRDLRTEQRLYLGVSSH